MTTVCERKASSMFFMLSYSNKQVELYRWVIFDFLPEFLKCKYMHMKAKIAYIITNLILSGGKSDNELWCINPIAESVLKSEAVIHARKYSFCII